MIESGLAEPVLRACGQMLRRIHAIDPAQAHVADHHHRDSAVLVHGDYGPQNCLLGPAAHEVIAVVDWEWAHAGDPVEDLAWCGWIVRMHHPPAPLLLTRSSTPTATGTPGLRASRRWSLAAAPFSR
jgi:aminoglycoside phosphotransferase (APT) family kinase protein